MRGVGARRARRLNVRRAGNASDGAGVPVRGVTRPFPAGRRRRGGAEPAEEGEVLEAGRPWSLGEETEPPEAVGAGGGCLSPAPGRGPFGGSRLYFGGGRRRGKDAQSDCGGLGSQTATRAPPASGV